MRSAFTKLWSLSVSNIQCPWLLEFTSKRTLCSTYLRTLPALYQSCRASTTQAAQVQEVYNVSCDEEDGLAKHHAHTVVKGSATAGASEQGKAPRNGSIRYYVLGADKPYVALELLEQALIGGTSTPAPFAGGKVHRLPSASTCSHVIRSCSASQQPEVLLRAAEVAFELQLRGVQLHVQALALLAARLLAVGEKDAGMQLLEVCNQQHAAEAAAHEPPDIMSHFAACVVQPGGRATTSTDATGTGRAASAGGAALTGKQPKGRAITYYVVDAQGTDKLHIGLELLHRAVCERNGLGPRHGSKSIRLPSASTADHILRACCDSKDAGLLLKAASTAENLGICHVELHTETIAMLAARLFAIGHVDDGLRLLNVCAGQQATAQHSFEAADGSPRPDASGAQSKGHAALAAAGQGAQQEAGAAASGSHMLPLRDSYAARISGRPDLQQALADAHVIHQQLRATGGLPDIDFQSTYMLLAATCGEPATVDMLWKELQRVGLALNAAAYHAIILCRSETSSAWAASLLTDMRKAVPKLDQASSCHLLFATLHARQIHAGSAIWAQMAEQGVQPSWLAYAAYLTALLQAGKHAAPFEILARLGERFRAARDEVGGATLPPGEELMAPNPPWPLHLPSSADLASLFQHLICRVVSMPVIPSRRRHVLRELIKEMGRSKLIMDAAANRAMLASHALDHADVQQPYWLLKVQQAGHQQSTKQTYPQQRPGVQPSSLNQPPAAAAGDAAVGIPAGPGSEHWKLAQRLEVAIGPRLPVSGSSSEPLSQDSLRAGHMCDPRAIQQELAGRYVTLPKALIRACLWADGDPRTCMDAFATGEWAARDSSRQLTSIPSIRHSRSRLLSSASTGSSVDQLRADVGNTRRLHSPGSERAGGTPAHDVEQHDLDASALSATGNHEAGQWRAFDSLLTTLGRTSFAAGDAREAGMSAAAAGKGSAGRPQAQQTWQTDQKKKQLQWPGAIVNLEVCSVLAGGLVAKGHAAHAFEVYSCHRQARGQVSASLLHIMMWAAINSPLDTRRRNIVRIAEDMQRGFPAASQPFWPMPMHNAIWDAFESGAEPGVLPAKNPARRPPADQPAVVLTSDVQDAAGDAEITLISAPTSTSSGGASGQRFAAMNAPRNPASATAAGPGKQPRKWWTFEELDVLTKLVKQNGARDWKAVLEKGQAQGVFKGRKAADICGKWHSWTSNGVPTLHSEHVVDRD